MSDSANNNRTIACVLQADGQYKDTCKNIQFTKADGGRIIADCDTGKDGFVRAALTNVNNCKKGIENNFGKLSCD